MNRSATNVLFAIRNLATLLATRSEDTATLRTIVDFTNDRGRWQKAHGLFDQIRSKNSKASLRGDESLEAQYSFEEVCVKTLYNLGRFSAPFDPDSPYWIIPNALRAGEMLGFTASEILDQIKVIDEIREASKNIEEAEQGETGQPPLAALSATSPVI